MVMAEVGGVELTKVGGMELAAKVALKVELESEGPAAQAIMSGVWPSVLRVALGDSWAWRRRKSYTGQRYGAGSHFGRRRTAFSERIGKRLGSKPMW